MKHNNTFYIQLTRNLFKDEYEHLSYKAKWLFVVLNELEHRFTGENADFFTRSNEQLAKDTGMSLSMLKQAKAELRMTDLIDAWQCHFRTSNNKISTVHYTAYRIKK